MTTPSLQGVYLVRCQNCSAVRLHFVQTPVTQLPCPVCDVTAFDIITAIVVSR